MPPQDNDPQNRHPPQKTDASKKYQFLFLACLLIVISWVYAPYEIFNFAQGSSVSYYDTTYNPMDKKVMDASMKLISSGMKDPSSVQFKGVYLQPNAVEGTSKVCGELNAKNSYGAYTGYEKFFVWVSLKNTIMATESEGYAGANFEKLWLSICKII